MGSMLGINLRLLCTTITAPLQMLQSAPTQ
jgi:hypothetical protein